MASALHRLGRFAHRRRLLVLTVWLFLLLVVAGTAGRLGPNLDNEFTLPGSTSQEAMDDLGEALPAAAGTSAQIVFRTPDGTGITSEAYREPIRQALAAAARAPQVAGVSDPFETGTVSKDGTTALATVAYPVTNADLGADTVDALEDSVRVAAGSGLVVETGGQVYGDSPGGVHATELIGVGVAVVVLLVTFGSVLAAGVPLLTALIGVGVGMSGLLAASHAFTVSSTAPTLALMLGLAVGLDYALFLVSRHRQQLTEGMPVPESVARATGTAGSAVLFAGVTVVIALLGLTVAGVPMLTVMGLSAAATVTVAVLVALTLVPALLSLAGERLRPRPGTRAHRRQTSGTTNVSERWVRFVSRRPWVTVVVGVLGLLVIAVPATDLELALPDRSTAPAGSTERAAYDIVAQEFGPGANGVLLVVADTAGHDDPQRSAQAVAGQVGNLPGVATAVPTSVAPDGSLAVVQVVPTTGPRDTATTELVETIRDAEPRIRAETGTSVRVTGQTAIQIDLSERLSASLVPYAVVVVGLSLLLLMLVFRSIAVPVKATLGYLLSIGAALGLTVAVFQWGWGLGLLGDVETGPLISFMPIVLMSVLFGLAMDYEVFLVSGMRETYVHTGDAEQAVFVGARLAGRVVVAAALIMVGVFASFTLSDNPTIMSIALALAAGVLVDAFVVRLTLVPAVLALLGRRAWWLPRALDRVLPDLDVEGARLPGVPTIELEDDVVGAGGPAGSRTDPV
ncbi:MMPL family transporter [Kineosporia succinea]|uniref:RND superfamily putative drug exporter n=1 Tax=Kineosporia succinea TaxID=84632 RepID=A0ABT9PE54_9ACTN|nr:MMPL family transporter [Kineosporia succinea]MDP9830776.1 RND superfamily putative drug exporter [Kineosporia succinea]